VSADVGEARGRFDFGHLAGVGGHPALAGFEFDGAIIGEGVGEDAGEEDFDGGGGRGKSGRRQNRRSEAARRARETGAAKKAETKTAERAAGEIEVTAKTCTRASRGCQVHGV